MRMPVMAKKVSLEEDDIVENLDDVEEVELAEDDDVPGEPEEEPKPKGRNTGLTITLCVLNVLAALGFAFLLVMDFQRRQDWSYLVFLNELHMQGLPLKDEDNGPSGSRVTMPRQKLDSKQIKDVFSLRGGKGGGEFWVVDEPMPNRIEARHLTKEILKDYFGSLGAQVATLEDEVERLKNEVPKDIASAAQEAATALAKGGDPAKRQFLANLLMPLAYDIFQVEALDRKLKAAKGLELNAYLEYAVQRRLLVDILAPCEVFRPGDVNVVFVEQVVIAKAAADAAGALKGKDDAGKRALVRKLMPLPSEVEALDVDQKFKAAKGPELDAYVEKAVQRRLQVDILAPFEVFWPGADNMLAIDKIGALDQANLEELKKLLQKRLEPHEQVLQKRFDVAKAATFDGEVHQGPDWNGVKRLSWEKRQTIGFLLLAIASLQQPDPARPDRSIPLYPDAAARPGAPNLLRAQTVLGIYEFAAAAQNLPLAWNMLAQRLIEAIHIDREGFDILAKDKDGKERPDRNQAFIDKHAAAIARIQELTMEIKKADDRLKDLQKQHEAVKKIFEDRDEHLKAMTKKLTEARVETARLVGEVQEKQRELFRAQVVLRDADEQNVRLFREIREAERKATGTKGAKTP
jgi:hypothetical protein